MRSTINLGSILSCLFILNTPLFPQVKANQLLKPKNETQMEKQSNDLKEYILLVRLPLHYGPDKAKEVREKWNTLVHKWKENGTYITSFVYPNDGYLITGPEKTITHEGVVSNNYKLVSNMILKAASYEAVVELAKECPVLEQGGMIEVREIQPRLLNSSSS